MKRELTADEYEALMAGVNWFETTKPKVIHTELTVFSPDNRFAGTVDLVAEIDGDIWIIDFKTGQNIWDSYRIQLNAYKTAIGNKKARMGILQLGFKRNKKKWFFTEIEDDMELFDAAYTIWQRKCSNISPMQKDYPLKLKLNLGGENDITTKTRQE
jgi:hypothetical protein